VLAGCVSGCLQSLLLIFMGKDIFRPISPLSRKRLRHGRQPDRLGPSGRVTGVGGGWSKLRGSRGPGTSSSNPRPPPQRGAFQWRNQRGMRQPRVWPPKRGFRGLGFSRGRLATALTPAACFSFSFFCATICSANQLGRKKPLIVSGSVMIDWVFVLCFVAGAGRPLPLDDKRYPLSGDRPVWSIPLRRPCRPATKPLVWLNLVGSPTGRWTNSCNMRLGDESGC